ncbi:hypothetical protein NM688_g2851 [Phlebia brevispora]|uniref:Uncharacterized protein n=1 Tax=Phlebia brevispora TaxID=194682 RepID=A0ACC1T841_9APHY|nr:hypothetical protein NM688_g2851 [Phlebia brevispora]
MYCTAISKFVLCDEGQEASWPATPPSPLSPVSPLSLDFKKSHSRAKSCSGYEVQESKNMYLVDAWETPNPEDDILTLTAEPQDYDSPPSSPTANLDYRIHVRFSVEPYTALSAPLTEIVLWTLRDGASRETVERLLTTLMRIVGSIPTSKGMYKAGWGPVLDNEQQFVVLIGWENMEAFQTAVKNSPEGRAVLNELDLHTTRQLRHVTLQTEPSETLALIGTPTHSSTPTGPRLLDIVHTELDEVLPHGRLDATLAQDTFG